MDDVDDEPFYLDDDAPDCAACGQPAAEHGAYPPYPLHTEGDCPGYRWPDPLRPDERDR